MDLDLLDRLSQAGVNQDLIDKGLEALDFFHAQDSAGFAARQMVMSASNPNALGQTIDGTCGPDVIDGGEGNDVIRGGAGNDIINGGGGDDTIYGGKGTDTINGGEGHDTVYGGDHNSGSQDNIITNGGEGPDTRDWDGPNESDLCTQPTVAIDDTLVIENEGYANLAVRLNQVYDQDITITWKTVNGSATSAGDFTATSGGTLVIAAFSSSGTISVPINNDSLDEADETFTVEITGVTNAELSDEVATATIIDNDTPSGSLPTVSISLAGLNADGLVSEGDGGAPFTVTLSHAINKTVRVHYATTTTGTAIDGTHYYSVSRDLYFEPNQTSKQIGVQLIDDSMYEGNVSAPYFFVTLSSPLNALIGTASGYAQIIDDDPLPTLSIADVTVTEGDPGGPAVYMSVLGTLSNPANFDVTFTLVITSGTATNGGDYTLVTTTHYQTISAGGLNSGVSFPVVNDLVPEPTEHFYATITTASVVLTDYQATCQIVDNDADMQIFLPRVVNTAEPVVSDAEEASIGSVTFVNLDNDDRDATFDYGGANQDTSVVGGDDELVKVKLIVPNNTPGNATLSATAGAGSIQVWTQNDKSSQYALGTAIPVPGPGWTAEGDTLVRYLWVEGIAPHTTQQESKLRFTFDAPGRPVATDDASLTVIGVQAVTWEGVNNSRTGTNVLDADPN